MKRMNYCTVGEELSLYIKWSLNSFLGEDGRRSRKGEGEGRLGRICREGRGEKRRVEVAKK